MIVTIVSCAIAFPTNRVYAVGISESGAVQSNHEQQEAELIAAYNAYQERFDSIVTMRDIPAQGYEIVEKHVFDIPLVTYLPEEDWEEPDVPMAAEVVRPEQMFVVDSKDAVAVQQVPTLRFFAAIEKDSHRAAVFLANRDGTIVYKTNQLECNYAVRGEYVQPIVDMVSVAFQDLNGDERMDIILIAGCEVAVGEGELSQPSDMTDSGQEAMPHTDQTKIYKIGEVLFQSADADWELLSPNAAEGSDRETSASGFFYRDWRVNDKLNRFGMNKNAKCIRSFVRDGRSTEFLYTATTETELLANGFQVTQEQSYWRSYEKLGRLKVLPGTFRMADYDIFMIYMINEQGNIVWSFHPMGEYDNLYSLRGMSAKDLDGDGMKDLLVVARYSSEGENGELVVEGQFSIYYQRTGGFDEDTEFVRDNPYRDEDTVEGLVTKIRAYWGWKE
ncbi:MAG: hypothetical protein NC413_08785 [Muribaculum sp.]|nr:hypothetical protein [Muribaculum sp.]